MMDVEDTIQRIDMRYRAKLIGSGGLRLQQATVKVYGQSVPRRIERPVVGSGWDEIDTKPFNRRDSRVVLSGAGRADGRFGQIKLRVLGDSARVESVRIRFGNGETQVVRLELFPLDGGQAL